MFLKMNTQFLLFFVVMESSALDLKDFLVRIEAASDQTDSYCFSETTYAQDGCTGDVLGTTTRVVGGDYECVELGPNTWFSEFCYEEGYSSATFSNACYSEPLCVEYANDECVGAVKYSCTLGACGSDVGDDYIHNDDMPDSNVGDKLWVVCGRAGQCTETDRGADPKETHEVRCCSDTEKEGWSKNTGCTVWGESDLPTCEHNKNYAEAQTICDEEGGRLCTRDEMLAGCTGYSGCGHDADLIWTSTSYEAITKLESVAYTEKAEEASLHQTLKQIELKQEEIEEMLENLDGHN